jgi:hypothetical protein
MRECSFKENRCFRNSHYEIKSIKNKVAGYPAPQLRPVLLQLQPVSISSNKKAVVEIGELLEKPVRSQMEELKTI